MTTILNLLITILQFTAGQRFRIYNRMRPIATRLGLTALTGRIDVARRYEETLQHMENQWSGEGNRTLYDVAVLDIDNVVDQTLTGIRDVAVGIARGLAPTHPTAIRVDEFLSEVFPNGVKALTSLPYVDQVMAVEVVLGRMRGDLAGIVTELGLTAKVDQLAELTAEYRRLVDLGHSKVEFVELRAAREVGQQYMREIIAIVLGSFFDSNDPEHVANREELLEPVRSQLEIQHAKARARRRGGALPSGEEEPQGEGGDENDDGGESDDGSEDSEQTGDAQVASSAGDESGAAVADQSAAAATGS